MSQDLFKQLPAIDKWLASDSGVALCAEFSSAEVAEVMREHLSEVRRALHNGHAELPNFESAEYAALMRADLLARRLPSLRGAINATGIVLHTNLGRAPLAAEAIAAVQEVARGYSNLELDLDTGRRGSRYEHVETLLRRLSGAEAAVVVNNCAAAVILSIDTLAAGGEVVVSRGESVEIGGSFRMPDVIAKSGARMVEVGTTNKTRIEDFSAALSEHTRVLLSVHASNFKIVGFTAKPELRELANLAHRNELVCMQDLGSGSLVDLPALGSMAERTVPQSIADGVDLITFSGDKLLGGPQAGIILGRREMIDAIKTNPLLRALRIDKLSLAALEATLRLYLPPNDPLRQIPILRMLSEPPSSVARRARSVVRKLRAVPRITVTLADDVSYGGGGSLPMNAIPTKVIQVRVPGMTAAALAGRLRMGETPVIGRIADELLLLDLRTVPAQDEKAVVSALQQAAR